MGSQNCVVMIAALFISWRFPVKRVSAHLAVSESRSILSIDDTNTFADFDPGWDSYCAPDPFYEERCVEV